MVKETRGRPDIITPEIIGKLEEVFAIGGSDLEACFYAGIGKTTLYNYQNVHPDFVERKEMLKEKPILKARQTVVKSLDDPDMALKYLERKRKSEFGNSLAFGFGDNLTLPSAIQINLINGAPNKSLPEAGASVELPAGQGDN